MSTDSTIDFLRERSRLSPLVLDRSHSHGTADHFQGSSSSSSNLHLKREKIIMEMGDFQDDPDYIIRPPSLPAIAHASQGHLHLQQSSDSPQHPPMPQYHITSIHPNRVMGSTSTLRLRRKLRNKSDDFCTRSTQSNENEWDDPRQGVPHEKKPLGEFLSEIKAESKSDSIVHVEENHTHQGSSKEHKPTNEFANVKESINEPAIKETPDEGSQDRPPDPSQLKTVTNGGPEYHDLSGCLSCDTCFSGGKLTIVPIMDSRDYTGIPPKERDYTGSTQAKSAKSGNHSIISWFRSKKKSQLGKHEVSVVNHQPTIPNASIQGKHTKVEQANAPEENYKGMQMAMEFMKEEVSQANKKKDDALAEVFQVKKAIDEMGKKLGQLENQYKSFDVPSKRISDLLLAKGNREDHDGKRDKEDLYELPRISSYRGHIATMGCGPTKREFCHAVVEARVGVKQFCRTLLQQLREQSALDKIDTMLKAQNLKVNFSVKGGTVSKRVKYLIESLVNQAFYEDFENIKFRKSGSHCVLDPRQRPVAFFKTYMGISQVGWSELVSKDSSAYSESFDGFCDQKMNKIVEELLFFWDLEGGWPDELVKAFFVAAKWVWLLHLLAFSFEHPATIFRVCNESHFDPLYMEELPSKDHENGRFKLSSQHFGSGGGGSSEHDSPKILAMVMPGFFFNSYEVIRCKVLISNTVR
ncbi:hypothetical protein GOP47_0027000 [Adiantum capillus-veneris]|nr:hypothetical protein GOP47_0031235 [Adiantum capillus-veneris]KAI5058830.1 hypothetical protein GOP47_0027000 [Adiantum capillus-veneris]